MTSEQLRTYAERGVLSRLHEIRAELHDLATDFPQLVESFRGPNGTVTYDTRKRVAKPNGRIAKPNGHVAKPNGKAKVHHTQTPEWKAMMSKRSKAMWRRKRKEEQQAGA